MLNDEQKRKLLDKLRAVGAHISGEDGEDSVEIDLRAIGCMTSRFWEVAEAIDAGLISIDGEGIATVVTHERPHAIHGTRAETHAVIDGHEWIRADSVRAAAAEFSRALGDEPGSPLLVDVELRVIQALAQGRADALFRAEVEQVARSIPGAAIDTDFDIVDVSATLRRLDAVCCNLAGIDRPLSPELSRSDTSTPRTELSRSDKIASQRLLSRDARQTAINLWAAAAFGADHAASLPQRGVRLAEEAIELAQSCDVDASMLHRLIDHVYARPPGTIFSELGGVGVTLLALAYAAGHSADTAEAAEVARVLSKPLEHFKARNEAKNAAGFNTVAPTRGPRGLMHEGVSAINGRFTPCTACGATDFMSLDDPCPGVPTDAK